MEMASINPNDPILEVGVVTVHTIRVVVPFILYFEVVRVLPPGSHRRKSTLDFFLPLPLRCLPYLLFFREKGVR